MTNNIQQDDSARNTHGAVTFTVELHVEGGERWVRAMVDGVNVPDVAQQRAIMLKVASAAMHYLAQTSDGAEVS